MTNEEVLKRIKGGMIVSCQALPEEPLHSSFIMGRMAYAAALGGASGIRTNSVEDIKEIKKNTDLPLIAIIKHDYPNNPVRITPTIKEIDELAEEGVSIIATDATDRIRPDGKTLDEFFKEMRNKYKSQLFMADCATYEEVIHAQEIGFDLVGTTLRGYTENTKGFKIPDFDLIRKLSDELKVPLIAEGGIWTPEQLRSAIDNGAYACVVGTAITRPMEITKYFLKALD